MNAVYAEKPTLVARIRSTAERYSRYYADRQQAKQTRAQLIPLLAKYKQKFVCIRRAGGWSSFIASLKLPVSLKTIDRAIYRTVEYARYAEIARRTELILNRYGWKTERGNVSYVGKLLAPQEPS